MHLPGSLAFRDFLKKASYYISYGLNYNRRNPVSGIEDVAYEETMAYVKEHMRRTMTFAAPSSLIDHAIGQITAEGLICEFGVFKGGTINHIAKKLPTQEIHGFDSFEGLPEDWYSGDLAKGKFSINGKLPAVRQNVILHQGWFEDTLPAWRKQYQEKLSFVHIDCDVYSATKTVFEALEKQFQAGTIIVFDEYFNYPDWQNGEFKAFQDFVARRNISYTYLGFSRMQVAVKIDKIGGK